MRMNPDSKKFRTSSKEACWTVSNVREILKRREYTGVMVMNQRRWKGLDNPRTVWTDESEWQIIPDCHEAIVSESEYEEAQKVFRKIRKGYDRSPDQYLLRSLVHCGACGRTIFLIRKTEQKRKLNTFFSLRMKLCICSKVY